MHMQLLADPFAFLAGFGIIGLILVGLASLFWLWMLIDAIINPRLNGTEKLIWVLVVLFAHFIGALLYFLIARGGRASGNSV